MDLVLHWGNKETLPKLRRYLSSDEKLNQFLYVNLGDEGFQVSAETTRLMREAFLELQTFLNENKPRGLRFKTELLETLPHVATLMTELVNGTNELYRNWSIPFRVMEQGPKGIEQHFKRLSEDLFMEIKPRPRAVNFAAEYVTYDTGGPAKGLELLQYNARLYPDSPWVLLNLARGYQSMDKVEKARQQAESALEKVTNKDDKLKASIEAFMKSLDNG